MQRLVNSICRSKSFKIVPSSSSTIKSDADVCTHDLV